MPALAATGRTALLVIGPSQAVVAPDSRFVASLREQDHDPCYFVKRVAEVVVPNVNALARSVRSASGAVFWIRPEWRTDTAADWPTAQREGLVRHGFDVPSHDGLDSFDFPQGLAGDARDHYFSTFSPSAFWGSPVLATLRNLAITDVLITGFFTESAVIINASDSTNTGFFTHVVDDACASLSQKRHDRGLALHARLFQATKAADVIAKLSPSPALAGE